MIHDAGTAIVESAYALACSLPSSTAESVAAAIPVLFREFVAGRDYEAGATPTSIGIWPLRLWIAGDVKRKRLMPEGGVVALQTAALSEQTHRDSHSVELVWTGPDNDQIPFRRTEQQFCRSSTQPGAALRS